MKTELYVISAYSNMHVGSGEMNFGVIDNLIQRDVVTGLPAINSSSLKGALREYFKNIENVGEMVTDIFGSESRGQNAEQLKQGKFRFFEAKLLSIPVRCDKGPYLRATSCEVLKELLTNITEFALQLDGLQEELRQLLEALHPEAGGPFVLNKELEDGYIEDFDLRATFYDYRQPIDCIQKLLGNRFVILHNTDFSRLCDNDHLPVMARNNLNNGESKNLWYEQIIPRFTHFYFVVMKDGKYVNSFDEHLSEKLIQIGANATIGYGYSRIQKINLLNVMNYEN